MGNPRVTWAAGTAGGAVAAWRAAQSGVGPGELAYRRDLARYERTVGRLRTRAFVAAVAAVATAVAAIGGPPWWLCVTAVSLWYGVTGCVRLRRTRPPQRSGYPTQWSPALTTRAARGSIGAEVAERLAVAEANLGRVVPAVERLYPPAGAELSRAVDEAAPLLHQQVERLAVLDRVTREMGPGPASTAAREAAVSVTARLQAGVEAYEGLLAAAAELLGAPDLGRSAGELLDPAVQGMQAYTHGLGAAGSSGTS